MSNHGLFEITQLQDAQAAWEIFFNRFYSAELPKQVNVQFDWMHSLKKNPARFWLCVVCVTFSEGAGFVTSAAVCNV